MANSFISGPVTDALVKVRGLYSVSAADATAGTVAIAKGLPAGMGWIVAVFRAGTDVTADAVVTRTDDTLTVANGTTYHLTAGDSITMIIF